MGQDERAEMEEFAAWLGGRGMATKYQTPHFRRWVQRFLRLRSSRPKEVWEDTLRFFLDDLDEGNCKGWQVRQAADAVTLYCGRFCEGKVTGAAPVRPTPRPRAADNRETEEGRWEGSCRGAPGSGGHKSAREQHEAGGGETGREDPGPGHGGGGGAKSSTDSGEDRAQAPAAAAGESSGHGDLLTHRQMLAEMRRLLRLRHYAPRTERVYLGWAERLLRYVGRSGEHKPMADDVQDFLSHLAVRRKVAASTQNQACNGILFLFRHVLMEDMGDIGSAVRARQGRKLPVVLSAGETAAVLAELRGTHRVMLELMYGGGLRVGELVQLRVKDMDFEAGTVTVRAGKGDKDRVTFLAKRVVPELKHHLEEVKAVHERDLAAGAGEAPLPNALHRKYPNAGREWGWQFVFPSSKLHVDGQGTVRRWHVTPSSVQRAMKGAVRRSGIAKPASCHSMRHSFATSLLLKGADIRRVQDLLGHKSVETTMIYLHVLQSMAPDLSSPLDDL